MAYMNIFVDIWIKFTAIEDASQGTNDIAIVIIGKRHSGAINACSAMTIEGVNRALKR